jgi:hypothetical protein
MKTIVHQSVGAALIMATLLVANPAFAQRIETTTMRTTSEGTVSEFGPQGIVIKTDRGTEPVRYLSRETTNYVDENGNPVPMETVKSGLPVTVYYTKVGDTLFASKIVVRTVATVPSRPIESRREIEPPQTTTTSMGTISESGPEGIIVKTESSTDPHRYGFSKTTTYVDENGDPVSIEAVKSGLPVTVYYTRIGNTLMASKVIVRKSIAAPTIEQKKTTTTTTR